MAEENASDMAYEILSYLSQNPRAQDTLEGIVQWWLLEREIRRSQSQVQQALEHLAARGFIEQRRGSDGRTRFSLNPARRSEIESWLDQQRGRRSE